MTDPAAEILARAIEWAHVGAQIARRRLGRAVVSRKQDRSPVTDADHAVQEAILDRIASHYPDHAVITEETVRQPGRHRPFSQAEWCWVIDPIDGTRNYARGMPGFAISIGVLRDGLPAVGAVLDVMGGPIYTAIASRGAYRNGQRVRVRDDPPTRDTMIGSPSGQGRALPAAVHEWFDRMTLRNMGSTALHLAMVAAGMMDAAFCLEGRLWDVAAGALLVTEAGGMVTDLHGEEIFPVTADRVENSECEPFLAAGPTLHRRLLDWLRTTTDRPE